MKNSPEKLYLSAYLLYEDESDFKRFSTGDYVEEHKTAPDGVPYVTERHHESDVEYIREDIVKQLLIEAIKTRYA